ncbi:RNA 2',3'-cyclic phosphodiesterase [Streptomyces sp. NPDC048566]|uniref:RNA 2',3'-cyclic phosphodiesterase n=1 Tax=Streptomyces sp. NPDC048566 TaxID=3365569 RepID=UPI003720B6DB
MRYEVAVNDQPPPTTVRVFVALAPPDGAKAELAAALAPAYAAHPAMRWNRIEDWHITLAFLGQLPAASVPRLRPALAALAARRDPLSLALRGSGTFDDRVVWSGVEGDLTGLHGLAADVRSAVRDCGVGFAERPFRPHLTLARARRGDVASAAEIARGISAFAGRCWPAEHLHLVGSHAGPGPGRHHYRDIDAWPLGRTVGHLP